MIQSVSISTNQSSHDDLVYTVKVDRNKIELTELTFKSKPGDYVEQQSTLLAVVTQANGKTKNVLSNVSGFIQCLYNDRLTNSSIKICLIHECDHAVVKFDEANSKDICEKCGKDVWIKGDSVISIIKDTKQMTCAKANGPPESHDLDVVSWCDKKVNQLVFAKEAIVEVQAISRSAKARGYASSDEDESENSDDDDNNQANVITYEYYLNFPVIIKEINKSFNDKRDWLIKYEKVVCSHQMAELNTNKQKVCGLCKEALNQSDLTNKSIYFGLGSEFKDKWLSRQYAEQYKVQAQKKLMLSQRLILVLDLDNTLLHAVQAIEQAEYSQKGKNEGELCEVTNFGNVKYVVRLRPYLKEFLEQVLPHYEIYVFTMGIYEYASGICEFLRTKYSELLNAYPLTFSSERIISREAFHDPTCKNLNQILPDSDRFMLVLDDRPDVWAKQPKNLITTLPYIYWLEGAGSWNQTAFQAVLVFYKNASKFRATKRKSRQIAKEEQVKINDSAASKDSQEIEIEGSASKPSGEVDKQTEAEAHSSLMHAETSIVTENEGNDENIPEITIDSFQLEATTQQDKGKQCDISYSSSVEVEVEEDDQTNSNKNNSSTILDNSSGSSSSSAIVEEVIQEGVGLTEQVVLKGKEEIEIQKEKEKQINGVEQSVSAPKSSSEQNVENKKQKGGELFLNSKEFKKNISIAAILEKFDKEENYEKVIKYNLSVLRSQDNYLLFAGPLLKSLKQQFFAIPDESQRDIRPIFTDYQKMILSSLVLVFKPNCQLYSFQRAKALGATVFIEGDDNVPDRVDYVIGKQGECQPNVDGQSQPLLLISEWIDYCWFYSYKLVITPFLPAKIGRNNIEIEQEIIKLNLEPSHRV